MQEKESFDKRLEKAGSFFDDELYQSAIYAIEAGYTEMYRKVAFYHGRSAEEKIPICLTQ